MTKPNYQDIKSDEIREIQDDDGSIIRVITGIIDNITSKRYCIRSFVPRYIYAADLVKIFPFQ